MAATSSVKKSRLLSWANSGAMSTPARLASTLDRIHENSDTRSASTPWSCSRRGLSTTARICSPSEPRRNRSDEADHDEARWHDQRGDLAGVEHEPPARGPEEVVAALHRPERRRVHLALGADDQQHDLGQRHEQAERRDQLGQRRRGALVAVDQAVEHPGHGDAEHHHRHEHGGQQVPLVLLAEHVEHRGRCVRLCRERQVEHARRLVVERQADGEQREHAPEGDALDGVLGEAAEVVHVVGGRRVVGAVCRQVTGTRCRSCRR